MSPGERREIVALVHPRIRWRFKLDADGYAARLQALLGTESAVESPLSERVGRLSLDDLYLAWACVQGEDAAWREVAQLHFPFIRSFARRYLPAEAATDTADEVIADLWERRKLERYYGRSSLRTWLGALVAHHAINVTETVRRHARKSGALRVMAAETQEAASDDTAADAQARDTLRAILSESFRALPAQTRVLLQLYYEQELTLDEIGRSLHVSPAALSRRLKHARETLRADIEARARRRAGVPADALREGVDLARLEVDLGALLNENSRPAV